MMNNESRSNRVFDLNERLISFAVSVIAICDKVSNTRAGNHLANQLVRSGTSPALNYGEAQSGESTRDFIHKLKIVLKELRETNNTLQIILRANLFSDISVLNATLNECNELISIFVKSIATAQANSLTKRNR
jgi:four helix bundle protein